MMKSILLTLLFCTALVVCAVTSPSTSYADIYRYVDLNGVIHFTNTPTTTNFKLHVKQDGSRFTIQDMIQRCATVYRLEEALIQAVIKVESDFNPSAVSSKGGSGDDATDSENCQTFKGERSA